MATETTKLTFVEGAAASTPAASRAVIYSKADGLMYSKDDAGVETLMSAGSAGMTNPLTTTGDMIYSSSGTTPARLAAVAAGRVITSAGTSTAPAWALPPGYEFNYVEITSNVTVAGTGTDEAGTTLVVAGGAVTYDGTTIIIIHFFAPGAAPALSAADRDLRIYLFDGTTNLGFFGYVQAGVSNSESPYRPVKLERRLTPSAASHTYSVRAGRTGADATIQAGAGGAGPAFLPAFIRQTKV